MSGIRKDIGYGVLFRNNIFWRRLEDSRVRSRWLALKVVGARLPSRRST